MARSRVDYYELLGLPPEASAAEIRRAFKRHSRRFHPALNPGDMRAAERFAAITRAFEVLSDPERRAHYDGGGEEARASPQQPQVGFEGFDFSLEVRRGGVGFRELFDGILSPSNRERGTARRGEDIQQSTRLSFEESLEGARRTLRVVRQDQCPACGGEGAVAIGPVTCPTCRGAGRLRASRGHMVFTKSCADCGGAGQLDTRPCGRCSGDGRVAQAEQLEVEIPPGVSDGSRVEVPEAGNAGHRGGPSGDFVLVVHVAPHPFYRREGDDLVCRVPIAMAEAALGAHVEIPTPEGPITIEVPAGTQTGQRFRLRKRGVPRLDGSGRGDLYVEAEVVVPRIRDERSRALLEEFARLNGDDPRRELLESARVGREG